MMNDLIIDEVVEIKGYSSRCSRCGNQNFPYKDALGNRHISHTCRICGKDLHVFTAKGDEPFAGMFRL